MSFPNQYQFHWCRQTVVAMKLTAFLILVACLQVSARGYTQESVTLNEKNADLASVLKKITKQTGVHFVHRDEWLKDAKPVTISVQNKDLASVLQILFQGQPMLTYERVSAEMVAVKYKQEQEKKNDNNNISNPPIDIHGRVVNEKGEAVEGVTVTVKGTKQSTYTNVRGEFSLATVASDAVLVFTSVNMETFELAVSGKADVVVTLKTKVTALGDVTVTPINTGYQTFKPNEVTGSVVSISKERLNEKIAPDVLSKLNGITNGLSVEAGLNGVPRLRIRGESTIFANAEPLIVVDNFPYDGNISNINPNDVENVTVLKDAAAASIWGTRAGNGVIVITTKRGRINQPLRVSLTINTSISDKSDLYYKQQISSSDYVDFETDLFRRGYYTPSLSNINLPPLSPVVEILNKRKLGLISAADSASQIDAFRGLDYREDYLSYVYQKPTHQQYHLNLSGGSNRVTYYFAAGLDKARGEIIGDENSRVNLTNQTTFIPVKNLEIRLGLNYIENRIINNGVVPRNIYPYTTLFDANGNELNIPQHRAQFEDTIINRGFFDWKYYPLQERNHIDFRTTQYDTRWTTSVRYTLLRGLIADLSYGYQRFVVRQRNLREMESYDVRNEINRFAILLNGNYAGSNFPIGDRLDISTSDLVSNNGRATLNYSGKWKDHAITTLAGFEARETKTENAGFSYIGFSNENGSFALPVDTVYKIYLGNGNTGTSKLGLKPPTYAATTNRFRSLFANAAYSFKDRYMFSASVRFDGSNYFGVKTNQKTVPLWSAGAKWDISKEKFYNIRQISDLSFRVTYGYNGNLDKNTAAITTIQYQSGLSPVGLTNSIINNIPNPELRWERTAHFNVGMDFKSASERFTGSLEYFHKQGNDLIGEAPLDPTTGVTRLTGNFSGLKTTGVDFLLSSTIMDKKFRWVNTIDFNYATEVVTKYDIPPVVSQYLSSSLLIIPEVGKPLHRLYSYRWAGLDPATGDPRIILSDTVNKSYAAATVNSVKGSDLEYHGKYFAPITGFFYNSVEWKGIRLAINVTYKFNYYFRRNSISYSTLISNWFNGGHSEYADRWRVPGDEARTNVPSFIYPLPSGNINRENFYKNANILVEKGDHVRLQYINLSYTFNSEVLQSLGMQSLQIYFYAQNLGILWRANDKGIDPDYINVAAPNPKTYSFGLRTIF